MKPLASETSVTFPLNPIPASAKTWLVVLTLLLPIGIAGLAYTLVLTQTTATLSAGAMLAGAAAMLIVPLAAWLLVARSIERQEVRLSGNRLDVAIPYTRKQVALSEIDLSRARIVDLNERTELRPLIRLWGIGLPGLSCGWHLLRNRRRAVVAIFGGRRALWLPTQLNFDLLLELQQPQTLLDALHARR
ncbi:MAG: hypothetical protein JNN30_09700 [Rhodanobacteraceae bacterium]|nr:hypothetical protein [Rhodanobacteraceae bacterium]